MARKVFIRAGGVEAEAELFYNVTGDEIFKKLPITGAVKRWGEEIYFAIPVTIEEAADARDVLEEGELGYWPAGEAFCIFFGKTPSSRGEEIRAAGNVNVFGRVVGDAKIFGPVEEGTKIVVEALEES